MKMSRENIEYYVLKLKSEGLLVEYNINENLPITSLTFDSRNVEEGALFICKGAHFDVKYLEGAISKGALCYVSEKKYDVSDSVSEIIVNDIRRAMTVLALAFYGDLSKKIKTIGITGTKGKSTTTYFTKYIFDEFLTDQGKNRAAYCSGIKYYDGVNEKEPKNTTPEGLILFEYLNNAVNSGIEYMVMEVSSQGLKYGRVDGIEFSASCFINIGQDHVSPIEHPTFEDYFHSKLSIFKKSKIACINMDSDYYDEVEKAASVIPYITYSVKDESANIFARNIKSVDGNVEFDVVVQNVSGYEDTTEHIKLAIFGTINVIDALASIALALSQGVPMKYCVSGLAKAVVPGRMMLVKSKDGKRIGLADYAHNGISFKFLLSSIKQEFPDKDIIMVFGAAGGKAYNRRAELGEVAGEYSKHIILTEDDSGEEGPLPICEQIAAHIGSGCTYEIILDRPEAVRKAIKMADENTIVIAAGKSTETTQKRGQHSIEIESDYDVMIKEFALL